MKKVIYGMLICLGLSSMTAFACSENGNHEQRNIALVTKLYNEIYEKKDFNHLDKYLAKDVAFYKNFAAPLNYDQLKNHLVTQGQECTKISMLPFDKIFASGNQVVTLYTRKCADKSNNVHNRRVMAITEFNSQQKVSKIMIVTHENENA